LQENSVTAARPVTSLALAALVGLLVALASDPPPASGSSPRPNGGPGGAWSLLFSDEFTGSSLDLSAWWPNWFGATPDEITEQPNPVYSDACASPAMVNVTGGELRMRVLRRRCAGHRYTGAAITSNPAAGGNFEFTYGYIEFRAILPAEDGIWTALWTNGQSWPADGEIDVMESGLPWASRQGWYYHDADGVTGGYVTIPSASARWHTYAAFWEPGRIRWYYDGNLVGTQATGVIAVPHYIVLTAADWRHANPYGPAVTRVDYVRVWERNPNPPPPARKASVSASGSTLTVNAGPTRDNIVITRPSASTLRVTNRASGAYTGSRIDAGPGCTGGGSGIANCSAAGIALIKVSAGDRADRVQNSTPLKSALHGGGGNDALIGGSARDTLIGGPGANAFQGKGGGDLVRARNFSSDTEIDCGDGNDKAELDRPPKDPDSAIKDCESQARP
jgi:hypothetical protein